MYCYKRMPSHQYFGLCHLSVNIVALLRCIFFFSLRSFIRQQRQQISHQWLCGSAHVRFPQLLWSQPKGWRLIHASILWPLSHEGWCRNRSFWKHGCSQHLQHDVSSPKLQLQQALWKLSHDWGAGQPGLSRLQTTTALLVFFFCNIVFIYWRGWYKEEKERELEEPIWTLLHHPGQ